MGSVVAVALTGLVFYFISTVKSETQKVTEFGNKLAKLLAGNLHMEVYDGEQQYPTVRYLVKNKEVKIIFLRVWGGGKNFGISDTVLRISCLCKAESMFRITKRKKARFF